MNTDKTTNTNDSANEELVKAHPLTLRGNRDELKRTLILAKGVARYEREVRKQQRIIKRASRKFYEEGSMSLADSQAIIAPAVAAKEAALADLTAYLTALARQTIIFNPETETNIWSS